MPNLGDECSLVSQTAPRLVSILPNIMTSWVDYLLFVFTHLGSSLGILTVYFHH